MIQRIYTWFVALPLRKAAWLLPLAWIIHEGEEWHIDAWYQRFFIDPGYFDRMHGAVLWIGLAFVALQGVVWTAIATIPRNPRVVAYSMLPYFIFLPFGNALQHVFWLLYFKAYSPGVVTAVLLVIPTVTLFSIRAIRQRLVPWWYVSIFVLATLPDVVTVIRAGNEVSASFQSRHQSGMELAKRIVEAFN